MKEDTQLKSKILLSPEVRRIKNAIIKKFADEPLDVMSKFVKEIVETENDTIKRLGAMAARVEILRMRISQISDKKYKNSNSEDISEEKLDTIDKDDLLEENQNNNILSDWVRLRIDENSEINGVRFPKGVVIDVSKDDAEKLINHKKASYIIEEENLKSNSENKNILKPLESEEKINSESVQEVLPEEVIEKSENKDDKEAKIEEVTEKNDKEAEIEEVTEKNEKEAEIEEVTEKNEKEVEIEEVTEKTQNKNVEEALTKETLEEAENKSKEKEKNNVNDKENITKETKKPSPEELLAGFKMDEKNKI